MKRIVVDATVLLSALVGNPDAAPAILLEPIHQHAVEMILCPASIAEVLVALAEPYFRALLDEGEAERAVTAIQRIAVDARRSSRSRTRVARRLPTIVSPRV